MAKETKQEAGQTTPNDQDFLNAYAGEGTKEIDSNAMALSYLQILQNLSDVVVAGKQDAGVFFNTGTQMAFGTEVDVIPVAFKMVWDERDTGGKTVNRYEPNDPSVNYVEENVPGLKYPKKINPTTRNEIVETFAYALVLKDHPEAGFLFHTAGLGSMRVYRRWNTMLKQMLLPSGSQAPIFAKSWKLVAASQISKRTGKPFYALVDVIEGDWIDQTICQQSVLPARAVVSTKLLEAPAVKEADVSPEDVG